MRTRRAALCALSLFAVLYLVPLDTMAAPSCDPQLHLQWLARCQNADGSWGRPEDPAASRVRLTAMATRSFSTAGATPSSRTEVFAGVRGSATYGNVLKKALRWLIRAQDASGRFSTEANDLDTQLWAAEALVKNSGCEDLPEIQGAGEKAIGWLESALRPTGGWGAGESFDPLLTARAIRLVAWARRADRRVPDSLAQAVDRAIALLIERDARKPRDAAVTVVALNAIAEWKRDDAHADPAWLQRIAVAFEQVRNKDTRMLCFIDGSNLSRHIDGNWVAKKLRVGFHYADGDPQAGSWDPPEAAQEVERPENVPPAAARRARALIRRFAADRWADRESAVDEARRLGLEALPIVSEACRSDDPEIAARAAEVLRTMPVPCDPARIEATCWGSLCLNLRTRNCRVILEDPSEEPAIFFHEALVSDRNESADGEDYHPMR